MISVCIATYNGKEELRRQLDSIYVQLSEEDEIVISDDNSTDGTRDLVEEYIHRDDVRPKVRLLEGPCKGSPIPNFENALKHAKGNYIFLSDQDDKWMPNKVKVMMQALQHSCCVVSDCVVTDGELNVKASSFYELNATKTGWMHNLFFKNGYLGCCMAFRRCVLEKSLPFPTHTPMHDIWIGNIAAMYYDVKFINDKLIYFCRHDHNNSDTARKSTATLFEKIGFRLIVVKNLLAKYLRKK